MNPKPEPHRQPKTAIDWEATTWEGSRRRQLEHWAQMPLDDIFAAQEDMADFARELGGDSDGAAEPAPDDMRDGEPA